MRVSILKNLALGLVAVGVGIVVGFNIYKGKVPEANTIMVAELANKVLDAYRSKTTEEQLKRLAEVSITDYRDIADAVITTDKGKLELRIKTLDDREYACSAKLALQHLNVKGSSEAEVKANGIVADFSYKSGVTKLKEALDKICGEEGVFPVGTEIRYVFNSRGMDGMYEWKKPTEEVEAKLKKINR
ncbi:TPA: hypothetical protein ACPVZG_005316 [Vibrio parahaemolyticus]